jgi:hypothetical protein
MRKSTDAGSGVLLHVAVSATLHGQQVGRMKRRTVQCDTARATDNSKAGTRLPGTCCKVAQSPNAIVLPTRRWGSDRTAFGSIDKDTDSSSPVDADQEVRRYIARVVTAAHKECEHDLLQKRPVKRCDVRPTRQALLAGTL